MIYPFSEFFKNRIFMTVLLAWVIAQGIKIARGVIKERRFDFKWLILMGGMPSTHTAGVSALAATLGLTYGFDSAIFAVALVLALIIIFDAQVVRRASSKQAKILNKLIEDIYFKRGVKEEVLKELLGHTPIEVLGGVILGIMVAILYR